MRQKFTHRVNFLLLTLLLLPGYCGAQYFGRNKVLYRNFDFRVFETPHFQLYEYGLSAKTRNRLARLAESWYHLHGAVLHDSFSKRNPILFYSHHADFQQTRAIQGTISVGTGGVTEALKNRVVMPIMESNAQTDHVLGHELVHAFQYHILKDSMNLNAMNNLSLWLVEGMAEYMSQGYLDPATSLWLRDAAASNKLPALKDLSHRPDLYFPYRWGQAFWSYLTGIYGDTVIKRFFIESGKKGYGAALKNLFGMDDKTFSQKWQESIRKACLPILGHTEVKPKGKLLVDEKTAGKMNLVPAISPDGKYLAFWTEKNLFSLDLYFADASNGQLLKRITSLAYNTHIDQYSSYESSVAWSPDSKAIAFVAFAKGHNRLLIADLSGKIRREVDLPGISSYDNPAWSPDGKVIVVSGLSEGQSDLYAYNLESGKLRQLTNDSYSDLSPSWSPNGEYLVFSTDRLHDPDGEVRHQSQFNLALYHWKTGVIINLDVFPAANNLNPVYGAGGKLVYFLSDVDGMRNLYSYDLDTRVVVQRSNLYTGITGVTMYAPAISYSAAAGVITYSYFHDSGYDIYRVPVSALDSMTPSTGSYRYAAALPPIERTATNQVQPGMEKTSPAAPAAMKEVPYEAKISLDYVGSNGVGIQAGGYTTGLAGGVNGVFSDMAGDHLVFGALSLNGEILDIAGQFAYVNQKNRFNWGITLSHIPYLSGAQYYFPDSFRTSDGDTVAAWNYSLDLLRTFEDQVSVFASYPFSSTRRVEAGASFSHYYHRLDHYSEYYDRKEGYFLGSRKQKGAVPGGFNLANGYVALVGDNSFFGVTSPLAGHRFRVELAQYFGLVKMTSLSADYRKYIRFAPFTLATRNMYMGRYGTDAAGSLLPPLFLGYTSLVRGYDALTYGNGVNSGLVMNDLIGSDIYVTNAELRFPLTGPQRLSMVRSRLFLSELSLFTDGGVAWGNSSFIQGTGQGHTTPSSQFIFSSGVCLRINLFGYLVVEPFYAVPWQNGGWGNRSFGLNILPGW